MERREHRRYQICLEIEIKEKGSNFASRGSTTDISLGGCYIATIFPLAVGSIIDLTVWIAGEAVKGQGTVQTCHPGVGMGIMFSDFTREVKLRLEQYLRAQTPMLGEYALHPYMR